MLLVSVLHWFAAGVPAAVAVVGTAVIQGAKGLVSQFCCLWVVCSAQGTVLGVHSLGAAIA